MGSYYGRYGKPADARRQLRVAKTRVIVKKHQIRLFGEKLFSVEQLGRTVTTLRKLYPETITQKDLSNIVL